MAKHLQLRFGIESPHGGVYEGKYRNSTPTSVTMMKRVGMLNKCDLPMSIAWP
jgi:hypothetical protein